MPKILIIGSVGTGKSLVAAHIKKVLKDELGIDATITSDDSDIEDAFQRIDRVFPDIPDWELEQVKSEPWEITEATLINQENEDNDD